MATISHDAPPLLEPEEAMAPLLPVRVGTEPGTGADHERQDARHRQRGEHAEDEEQQDLCAQHGAVDGAVVDRAEPQHVGPDVHQRHDGLVDQEQDEQRDRETDAEPLHP